MLKMMVGNNLKDTQLQQIVNKKILFQDKDGDGKISFSEFCDQPPRTKTVHLCNKVIFGPIAPQQSHFEQKWNDLSALETVLHVILGFFVAFSRLQRICFESRICRVSWTIRLNPERFRFRWRRDFWGRFAEASPRPRRHGVPQLSPHPVFYSVGLHPWRFIIGSLILVPLLPLPFTQ
ncbi:hypothetical protein L596_002421 [Steinernema carpocapsae]|uniref:EF-hand domain-containing protein n=1 Tax=Steinernema carpocapsae TaxID=34508 RepID=A0A4U8UP93_STECR|nr:hypothetical protein L596_002421 [Steinernema carpocapsae]